MEQNQIETVDKLFIDKYRKTLLDTFKTAIRFLDENKIKYFVGNGSLIGTVRHQGMIPWDDDIDIYVIREDYNRLLKLKDEISAYGLNIASINDKNYNQHFAKIVNDNTTVLQNEYSKCITGVWIDVFPLDYTDLGVQKLTKKHSEFSRTFYRYADTLVDYSIGFFLKPLISCEWKIFAQRLVSLVVYRPQRKRLFKKYKELERQLEKTSGVNLFSATETGTYVFASEWFANSLKMPFEDFEVDVPIGYKEYLRNLYGNYMVLPPVEKRSSDHTFFYVNLLEKLDEKELKKRIKQGERRKIDF